jgi:hypothetical protein
MAPLEAGDARSFTKLMDDTVSPDRRFAVAVGTADQSRPQWELMELDGRPTYMIGESSNIANYLVSLSDFRVLTRLESNHSGTAGTYNHQVAVFQWSLDSRWLTEEHHWKWYTAQCAVHRIDANGMPQARLDLLPIARSVLLQQMLAKVRGSKPSDFDRYALSMSVQKITTDGYITAKLTAQVPKVDEEGVYLETTMTAKLLEGRDGGLSLRVTTQ